MQSVTARRQCAGSLWSSHAKSVVRPCAAPRRRPCRVQALFGKGGSSRKGSTTTKRELVVPEPSFNVPLGLLAISGLSAYEGVQPLAWFAGVLGVFLTFQATRVKFQFEPDALEVVISGQEEKQTENAFVGGRNRWRYDTFINWELWWPGFPILVYFKETQTKPEGQIHFFPVIFNGKQLYDLMVERAGPSKNSMPKN